jgi:hypothetical protein
MSEYGDVHTAGALDDDLQGAMAAWENHERERVVNGRTYKVTHLTCDYVEKPQVIGGIGRMRTWAGRTDLTLIPE